MADDAPMLSYDETVLPNLISVPIFLCIFTVQIFFFFFFLVVYLAGVLVPVAIQSRYPVPLFPQNLILLAGFVQFHCQFLLDKQSFHIFFSAYNIFAVAVFVFLVIFFISDMYCFNSWFCFATCW